MRYFFVGSDDCSCSQFVQMCLRAPLPKKVRRDYRCDHPEFRNNWISLVHTSTYFHTGRLALCSRVHEVSGPQVASMLVWLHTSTYKGNDLVVIQLWSSYPLSDKCSLKSTPKSVESQCGNPEEILQTVGGVAGSMGAWELSGRVRIPL